MKLNDGQKKNGVSFGVFVLCGMLDSGLICRDPKKVKKSNIGWNKEVTQLNPILSKMLGRAKEKGKIRC
jgi:hypothetical protein